MTQQHLQYSPLHSAIFHPRPHAFEAKSLAVAILIGAAVQIAASWFYNWFYQQYNYEHTRVMACIGYAAGTCVLCSFVCVAGEVGDARVATVVALLLALVGLYMSWTFWIQSTIQQVFGPRLPLWRLVSRPVVMAQFAWDAHERGVWTYHGVTFRGPVLLGIWIAEAGVILLPATLFARRMVTRQAPKCQACRRAVAREGPLLKFSARDVDGFTSTVVDRDFNALVSHAQSEQERADDNIGRIIVKLYRCAKCEDTHLLHAALVSYPVDRKGREKRLEQPLVENMVIGAEQAEQLKAMKPILEPEAVEEPETTSETREAVEPAPEVHANDEPQPPAIGL